MGDFGSDNRAGIPGTLHRISALRSRSGGVVGLTCRVGRAVSGHAHMVRDILEGECVSWSHHEYVESQEFKTYSATYASTDMCVA